MATDRGCVSISKNNNNHREWMEEQKITTEQNARAIFRKHAFSLDADRLYFNTA